MPFPKGWVPRWSPAAFLRAVRAAVVMPGVFAFTDKVIGNLQMATFAAFGSFATLVLASFGGTRRDKLFAHLGLALAGSALLTIGTAAHSPAGLAALVTVPVTFIVFFAGVLGPNAASGAVAAMLAYVLPAASAGTNTMIPDRLAGWWLASVVGTAAVIATSSRRGDDQLRGAASKLASAVAAELDAALAGTAPDAQLRNLINLKHELFARFNETPLRPTGLAAADQALADAVEMLEWCTSLLLDALHEQADFHRASRADRTLLADAAAVLRSVSSSLAGGPGTPDMDRLEQDRDASLDRLRQAPPVRRSASEPARASFHANAIAVAVLTVAAETLVATRQASPDWLQAERRHWLLGTAPVSRTVHRITSLASTAVKHASVRSIWFINSIRSAVALAVAVAVADVSSVQHGFWVVLGTLSVLRTNAASTGATAVRAISGTAIGFVIGGALLLAIGSGSAALWAVLPIAVFVAAYSPGTAPFAIGQAAFTVTVAVLFNLLNPVGWKVGVVRIEDVALGCAVSVVVGTLFWPRGLATLVGDDLADVFRSGAAYLTQAVDWATGSRSTRPEAAATAAADAERLDGSLRGWIAEQGTKHLTRGEVWRLIGGSQRLRQTARAVAELPSDPVIDDERQALSQRTKALTTWYEQLAELVGRPDGRASSIAAPTFAGDGLDAECESEYAVWLEEHLGHLAEHAGDLVAPAIHLAESRRQPWWR